MSSYMLFIMLTGCTSGSADVVLVLDESTSVGNANYYRLGLFINDVIGGLTISTTDVQVGCLTFSDSIDDKFYLNTYSTSSGITKAIGGFRSALLGSTYILVFFLSEMFWKQSSTCVRLVRYLCLNRTLVVCCNSKYDVK